MRIKDYKYTVKEIFKAQNFKQSTALLETVDYGSNLPLAYWNKRVKRLTN